MTASDKIDELAALLEEAGALLADDRRTVERDTRDRAQALVAQLQDRADGNVRKLKVTGLPT